MTSFSDLPAAWFKGRFSRQAVVIRAVAAAPVIVAGPLLLADNQPYHICWHSKATAFCPLVPPVPTAK